MSEGRARGMVLGLMSLVLGVAGCNPYVAATSAIMKSYDVATDVRSLSTQESDTQAELRIKAALLSSPVQGTSGLDVYCRRGVVVLVGVVRPGSLGGEEAVRLARETPDVRRVETYFVPDRPSWASDFEIKEKIRAMLVADPTLVSGRVDIAVYGGHVVLVGVVDSRARADAFIADARTVSGVVTVRSFIQS